MADILAHYGLNPPKHNNANISCPFPGEKDKHPSFTIDMEKNLWHDKRTSKGGDVLSFVAEMELLDQGRDFKEILKISAEIAGVMPEEEITTRKIEKGSSDSLSLADTFMRRKGIDISKLGDEIEIKFIGTVPALAIPTKNSAGKPVGEQRHYGDRKSLKKDSKNALFFSSIDQDKPLYFVEGVTDYLTMKQCGFSNTVGVCSATTSYKEFIKPILDAHNAPVKICFDFDKEKRTFTGFKAAMKIKSHHAKTVSVHGYLDGDINDAFVKGGKAEIEKIFNDADFVNTANEIINPDENFNPANMARGILKKHNLAKIDKTYWKYQNGVWGQISDEMVKFFVVNEFERTFAMEHDRKMVSEVEYYISILSSTQSDRLRKSLLSRGLSEENKDFIFLKDGKYNIFSGELVEYRPEDCVVSTLGIYSTDLGGRAYGWEKFMRSVTESDDDAEGRIAFIEQWFGYCMYPSAKFEKMLWLVGQGGNGKGTMLSVLSGILGEGNTKNIQISQLDTDQFARATMFGVYANIVADTERGSNVSSAVLKNLVGGDKISARHLYKDTFEFIPFAKQIFGTNDLPTHVRAEPWLQRRLHMIEFRKTFKDAPDVDLKDKLQLELGAIAVRAISGLKKLLTDGEFSIPKSVLDTTNKFIEGQDTVLDYFKNEMPSSLRALSAAGHILTIKEWYEDFKFYCQDCGISPRYIKTRKQFLIEMAKYAQPAGITISPTRVTIPDGFLCAKDLEDVVDGWEVEDK